MLVGEEGLEGLLGDVIPDDKENELVKNAELNLVATN
jgi:hypothetical protein